MRKRQHGVTHLLIVCTVCNGHVSILEDVDSLVIVLQQHGVQVSTQWFDNVRFLYVNTPKDKSAYMADRQRHRYMSGGIIQVSTKKEMYHELSRTLALLS